MSNAFDYIDQFPMDLVAAHAAASEAGDHEAAEFIASMARDERRAAKTAEAHAERF